MKVTLLKFIVLVYPAKFYHLIWAQGSAQRVYCLGPLRRIVRSFLSSSLLLAYFPVELRVSAYLWSRTENVLFLFIATPRFR